MHPVIHEAMLMRAFGLRNLVLMVRELQILAAPMNIELLAEQFARHGRAFDMPAGTSFTPRRIPFDLIRFGFLGSFPQHKIQRIALAAIDVHTLAGAQIIQ
jgi:hypothetical protein